MTTIQRENWKGKFFIVVRDKGRIKSKIKWTKNFTLKKAIKKFKDDETLIKNVKKKTLTNVQEIVDHRFLRRGKKEEKVQVMAEIYKGRQFIIRARSSISSSKNIRLMKREAEESAYERLAELNGLEYDDKVGQDFFERRNYTIKFSTVRYRGL